MKLNIKCPKCDEDIELLVNDDELKNALAIQTHRPGEINSIVVIPTWRCELGCPYCKYKQQLDGKSIEYLSNLYQVEKELTPDEWIKLLNSYSPAVFDFTGGEPLLYPGIVQVLNSLPLWTITSNTLYLPPGIDYSRCKSWTASFHPHISTELRGKFLENTYKISSQSIPLNINLVLTPKTFDSVLSWADSFNSSTNVTVNVLPYYDDKDFSWYKYPGLVERMNRNPHVRYEEKLFEYKGLEGNGYCKGGQHYFVLGPDGKAFRCLTDLHTGKQPISGLVNSTCNDRCMFPCDWGYGGRKLN